MSRASRELTYQRNRKFRAASIGLAIAIGCTLPAASQTLTSREQYCMELEQELARDWMDGSRSRKHLPKIEEEIRKQDAIFNKEQARAERANCYESLFIFGRALKRNRKCLRIHRKIEDARRRLTQLQEERGTISRSRQGSRRQDDLISSLARAGCGDNYQREARKRRGFFFPFGEDGFFGSSPPAEEREPSTILPFATYRTMCVRLCDGFYYPVSFSTLPSRFKQDASSCQTNCAAPAELFVHRNPGEDVEQMVSLDGRPYSAIVNAWRYRKEFIKGCSCKQAEYSPLDSQEGGGAPEPPKNSGDLGAAPSTTSILATRKPKGK